MPKIGKDEAMKNDQENFDSGLNGLPETVQDALRVAVQKADESCVLISGKTALYWGLVSVVNHHRRELETQWIQTKTPE